MSAQGYWNNGTSDSYRTYDQPQHGQGDAGYPSPYSHNQSSQSHQPTENAQDNEPMNWGYGTGDRAQQQPLQSHGYYGSQSPASYTAQQYPPHGQIQSYDQNQGYGHPYQNYSQSHDSYQTHSTYDAGRHSPQPPHYGNSATDLNRQASPIPYPTSYYPDQGYAPQTAPYQTYPGGPNQPEGERGLLGAVGGAAAGGFAGHKVNHGFMGAVGGAYAGHKLEDALKDKKKKKDKKEKYGHGRRNSSGSSSSDSSDSSDDEKKRRKYGVAGAGVAAAGGAAYAYQQHNQGGHGGQVTMAGNFSSSSQQISLDRDYDLIASCATVGGGHKLSSISLNDCLTNSWGHLQWHRGGGFGGSSRNARLVDGGRVLEAELGDGKGGWNLSRIRLDERITNNDGDLQFLA